MRFTLPIGNPTAVLDRTEGKVYHLVNAEDAHELQDLLNLMHSLILSHEIVIKEKFGLPVEPYISERNVQPTVTKCVNTECSAYDGSYLEHCMIKSPIKECEDAKLKEFPE